DPTIAAVVEDDRVGDEELAVAYRSKNNTVESHPLEIADHAFLDMGSRALDKDDARSGSSLAVDEQTAQADDIAGSGLVGDAKVVGRQDARLTRSVVGDGDRFHDGKLRRTGPSVIAGRQHADLAARIGLVVRALERGAGMHKRAVVAVVAEVRDP